MNNSLTVNADTPVHAEASILVVDDEPTNLAVLNELLRPFFRVQVARSGAEALRVVAGASARIWFCWMW